jgi:hypothetical protein
MKHHFCRRHIILDWNVQSLEREKLDPNILKLPLLYRHILDISDLVMLKEEVGNVRIKRTVLSATNWGEIILQYIMA